MMNPEVTIRRAQLGDEVALSRVGQATFIETFTGVLDEAAILAHCGRAHSVEHYRQWLGDADVAIWLAEDATNDEPGGYAVVARPELPMADISRDLELKRIYLSERLQGTGIGKQLLKQAVAHAQSLGAQRLLLGVYAGNTQATDFYKRHGFKHLTERQFIVGGVAYDDNVMSYTLSA